MAGAPAPAPATPPPAIVQMFGADGAPLDLSPQQAAQAFASGQAGFDPGQTVYLKRGGEVVAVTGEQAATQLEGPRGATTQLVGEGEWLAQEEARAYDTVGAGIKAVAVGATRGLSAGFADPALASLVGSDELQRLERYQQGAMLVGEVGGALLPLAFSGGTAAAAEAGTVARVGRALSAPTRAISALGEGGATVARGLGRGVGLAEEGLAIRAAESAARFGAEGALYGVGSAVSQAAVHDEQLTAEKLVASAGHGALLGGVLGAGTTAAGAALRQLADRGIDVATGLAEKATGKVAAPVADKASLTLEQKAQRLADTITGGLDEFSVQKSVSSTGATKRQVLALEEAGESVKQRVAKQLSEDMPLLAGKSKGAILSREQMAELTPKLLRQEGEKIGALSRRVDELAEQQGVRPDLLKMRERIEREVITPLEAQAGTGPTVAKMGEYAADFVAKAEGKNFSDVRGMRSFLDDLIYEARASNSASRRALEGVRNSIESEIIEQAEQVAAAGGAAFAAEYRSAKEGYRAAKWLEEALAGGAAADAKNRSLGLSEHLSAMAGGNAVGKAAGAMLGPLGELAGNALGGALSAYAANLTRKYGDQLASEIARRAVKTDVVRAVASVFDDTIGHKLRLFLSPGKKAAQGGARATVAEPALGAAVREVGKGEHRGSDPRAEFKRARERLAAYQAAPERARPALAHLEGVSPTLAAKAEQVVRRGADFLQSKLPSEKGKQVSIAPHLERYEPSVSEQTRWLRYQRAVTDPTTIFDDMIAGRLTPEAVEALAAVYPKQLQQIRAVVTMQLGEVKSLSYSQKVQLSTLLGVPGDATMTASFVARVQEAIGQQQPDAPQNRPPSRPLNKFAGRYSLDQKENV